jgi:hypothetical protein
MKPGEDCLHCHDGGRARRWTVAGTVYPRIDSGRDAGFLGAHVQLRDASGWTISLQTNAAGNFYTAESLAFPLQACVERDGATVCMEGPVEQGQGSCNTCHALPPRASAPGRLAVP